MAEEQPPEVKAEARQFMSDLIATAPSPEDDQHEFTGGVGAKMSQWRRIFHRNTNTARSETVGDTDLEVDEDQCEPGDDDALMECFWSRYYDASATSLWKMVYDEADSNETLDDTVEMITEFLNQTAAANSTEGCSRDHCFGIVHVLEGLEIEGLWFINGPNPEELFAANEDTSWYAWTQLGPEAYEPVKRAAADLLVPSEKKLNGKDILDTQFF
eukprot:CAMPEP_0201147524 /NCGR_PEP_ID=MMETSP0851-20130426/9077_1 /ASSEMBLY_ACC=CAM_ASM_000631 /TAXON_ID=183588 /ORGANISM="Pseudo-nitzschia fraudulenta, Strain WWA7" /LENGTH=214 /DNA_ID=CAMNT_0047423397 /DNA_START=66 /DNA_END=710 /DNA_ORIENTATION=+